MKGLTFNSRYVLCISTYMENHFLETDFAKIALDWKMYHQQCQLRRDVSEPPVDASSVTSDCCYSAEQWHYNSTVTPMKQIEGKVILIYFVVKMYTR